MLRASFLAAEAWQLSRLAGNIPFALSRALHSNATPVPRSPSLDATFVGTASEADEPSTSGPGIPIMAGPLQPQLCATPKRKLSLYRRGNRRVWYWLKRKPECAQCSFCGSVSGRANIFSGVAGNTKCTGECVQGPSTRTYAPEYKPPC